MALPPLAFLERPVAAGAQGQESPSSLYNRTGADHNLALKGRREETQRIGGQETERRVGVRGDVQCMHSKQV